MLLRLRSAKILKNVPFFLHLKNLWFGRYISLYERLRQFSKDFPNFQNNFKGNHLLGVYKITFQI